MKPKFRSMKTPSAASQDALTHYVVPDAVIGTKASSASPDWSTGDDRSLGHHCWLISSHDSAKKRRPNHSIFFDTPIDFDYKLLSDRRSKNDNLTKKIICIHALAFGISGRPVGAAAVAQFSANYDWVIRWRLSLGIDRTSSLQPNHFEHFRQRLESREISDFVPIIARLDRLVTESAAGRFKIQTYNFNNQERVNWVDLGAKLGVSWRSIARSRHFRLELIDRLEPLAGPKSVAVAEQLVRTEPNEAAPHASVSISHSLLPWQYLFQLSARGLLPHDPLTFDPFTDQSLSSISRAIGVSAGRTPTLLPEDFFTVLSAAMTWVLDYSEHVIRAYEILINAPARWTWERVRFGEMARLDEASPPGMPRIWLGWHIDSEHTVALDSDERISVVDAIKLLMTACAIVIAGFAARREGEIDSLTAACVITSAPGIHEMSVFIEKTIQDLDHIPVPAAVKVAVATLEKLSAGARALTGTNWLFQALKKTAGERPVIKFRMNETLDWFAEVNCLTNCTDGEDLSLAAHMFRRGFAILFYHGNRFSSLDALSRYLRHFNPEMTRLYMNEILPGKIARLREMIGARTKAALALLSDEDKRWLADARDRLKELNERLEIFSTVRCEYVALRMLEIFDGKENPIGNGAVRLYADLEGMIEKAAADVRLGSRSNNPAATREPLTKLVMKYANENFIEPVAGGAAQCRCPANDSAALAEAECLKAKKASRPFSSGEHIPHSMDTRPDVNFSSALVCLKCVHCVAFSVNLARIESSKGQLKESVERAGTVPLKEAASAVLQQMEQAIRSARAAVEGRRA